MKLRIFKTEIHISGLAIITTLAFIVAIFLFGLLGHEIVVEKEDWFDSSSFNFFSSRSTPELISFFRFITFFGSIPFLLSAYVLLILFLIYRKRKIDALCIGVIAIISSLLIFGLKNVYARPRPQLPLFAKATNYSFPSGHSLSSIVFCGVMMALVWESSLSKTGRIILSLLLLLFTLLVGISRIVLRYHFASDVVAGFGIGLACMILFFWLRRNMVIYRRSKK
jgi:undecaprenyl-diphosphatase